MKDLLLNGFPKAGNHAGMKACELLGVPAKVTHMPFIRPRTEGTPTQVGLPLGVTKHIFIIRDPRNILISWIRFMGKQVTPGMFMAYFHKFQERSLQEEMLEYRSWLGEANTLVVKYEDLIKDDREMRRIAAYLEVPYIEGSFEKLPGFTMTWNDEHSDWKKLWTLELAKAWNKAGGWKLQAEWGYTDEEEMFDLGIQGYQR